MWPRCNSPIGIVAHQLQQRQVRLLHAFVSTSSISDRSCGVADRSCGYGGVSVMRYNGHAPQWAIRVDMDGKSAQQQHDKSKWHNRMGGSKKKLQRSLRARQHFQSAHLCSQSMPRPVGSSKIRHGWNTCPHATHYIHGAGCCAGLSMDSSFNS